MFPIFMTQPKEEEEEKIKYNFWNHKWKPKKRWHPFFFYFSKKEKKRKK
jgi:hypothetical protein